MKDIGAIWTLPGEGEIFGKEVVSRAQKDFAESLGYLQ